MRRHVTLTGDVTSWFLWPGTGDTVQCPPSNFEGIYPTVLVYESSQVRTLTLTTRFADGSSCPLLVVRKFFGNDIPVDFDSNNILAGFIFLMLDFADLEKITAMSNVLHFYVTEVKNKIAYQSTNKVKKLKYFRKVVNTVNNLSKFHGCAISNT